jgi:hypothetical protein
MNRALIALLCSLLVVGTIVSGASATGGKSRYSDRSLAQVREAPLAPTAMGESMFQEAAATTTVLGWWQFDTPSGAPTKQGWTEHDMTAQPKKYWHVAGPSCPDAITPIAGAKSMWCGQWPCAGADPWCGWASAPGYGNYWDQSLESTVSNITMLSYEIAWESEAGYDFAYIEWWDAVNHQWTTDVNANGGVGYFTGQGYTAETLTSPVGPTKARFHFTSDRAESDEDGVWDTAEGALKVDNIQVNGGAVENWEAEACGAMQSTDGVWIATVPPGFGTYAALHSGATILQQDPFHNVLSNVWGFFDNPAVTNYACGGFPMFGAIPYGPDANGLYMANEIWSKETLIVGTGSEYILQVKTYVGGLMLDLIYFDWHIRIMDEYYRWWWWMDYQLVYTVHGETWIEMSYQVGALIEYWARTIQIALSVVDMTGIWGGDYGGGSCHSPGPYFDQVRLLRVDRQGPQYQDLQTSRLWQDNFPEDGGVGPSDYARCDMAQDILPSKSQGILPGDSLAILVSDPYGLAADNTGGRMDTKAVYAFVKVTDRFGNPVAGKNGLALQSPDVQRHAGDMSGLLRYPLVTNVTVTPPVGWDVYRMDKVYTSAGAEVPKMYCADLMDLAAGPHGPPYHPNENWAANTGIFAPGDVIHYFIGAKNTAGQWTYITRAYNGQGGELRTSDVNRAAASPMEWSVLPDAGREPGDIGDILYVDDADDLSGTPPQTYFDNAFQMLGISNRVDRFDVLSSSSHVGNSLESRVKNIQAQVIGDPTEIYQKVLWNTSDLHRGLMGDGGRPNGGSSAEKSDDYALCYTFLNTHPDNPGWAVWGDDFVEDWSYLVGMSAVNVKSTFMHHNLVSPDQKTITGVVSPKVYPASPVPPAGYLQPIESFYANGGSPVLNDFDVPGQSGMSRVSHRYANASTGQTAALSQRTPTAAGTNARFFLAGFGYDFIRDDDTNGVPDYASHLYEILTWFQNVVDTPTGIDPVAFANSLDDNYPNPFNPTTTIKYSIASAGPVSLKIYNAAGQLVRSLVDEEQAPQAGGFSVTWDGRANTGESVATGVYFYRLTAKDFSQTKKMALLK